MVREVPPLATTFSTPAWCREMTSVYPSTSRHSSCLSIASGGTSLTIDQLRLIKKYTNHLTIIYDGDGAGIKAALPGLDMALEEGLDVKLVPIPDKEDPDSYARKLGASAFRDFVAANKKDFVPCHFDVA